jgi:hypothetical protein
MGFPGFAAREYYFYTPYRPYRPCEGGEGRAQFKGVDIGATFDRKVRAILELKTGNHRYARHTWRSSRRSSAAGMASAAARSSITWA